MLKITYIVPFYNGQDSICRCLDSIYAIGLPENEFEVIVVDDKSPVFAEDVLKEWATMHPNLRVIRHDTNKRQGGAKNTGIRAAKGQYIAFADQDDVICQSNILNALNMAMQNDVDMLCCHYCIRHEDGILDEHGIVNGDGLCMNGKEFCENYFETGYNLAPWANLYKREFLKKTARPYEENVVMEDSDWIAWHWIHADKVGIYNKPIYTWVMNPISITHSQHYVNRADWIKYGYRKIRDAKVYKELSPLFAHIMINDGKQNIIGGMKKIWMVDSYRKFYHHLGEILTEIQQMEWKGIIKILICYPKLSIMVLSILGPVLQIINGARKTVICKH